MKSRRRDAAKLVDGIFLAVQTRMQDCFKSTGASCIGGKCRVCLIALNQFGRMVRAYSNPGFGDIDRPGRIPDCPGP